MKRTIFYPLWVFVSVIASALIIGEFRGSGLGNLNKFFITLIIILIVFFAVIIFYEIKRRKKNNFKNNEKPENFNL
jgi:hypothetical protein